MNRLVVVRLNGDLVNGGYQATTEIGNEGAASDIEIQGFLPALSQEFSDEIEEWKNAFIRLDPKSRLKVEKIPVSKDDFEYCFSFSERSQKSQELEELVKNLARSLEFRFNNWISYEGFRDTLKKLRSENNFIISPIISKLSFELKIKKYVLCHGVAGIFLNFLKMLQFHLVYLVKVMCLLRLEWQDV